MIIKRDQPSESSFGVEPNDAIVCLECKALNSGSRKFCSKCGENLWHKCPGCDEENPISDAFCGSCGDDLAKTLRGNEIYFRETLAAAKAKAKELDFSGAIALLSGAENTNQIRLKSQRTEVTDLINAFRERRDELKTESNELLAKAQYYLDKSSFGKSLQTLNLIPEQVRTPEMIDLISKVQQKDAEFRRLSAEIETLVGKQAFLEALPKIEMLAKLRPHDTALPKLANDITQRLGRKVEKLRLNGKFKEAYQLIQRAGNLGNTEKTANLKKELEEVVWLTKYIKRVQTLDVNLISVLDYLASKTSIEKFSQYAEKARQRLAAATKKQIQHPEWTAPPEDLTLGAPVRNGQTVRQIANFSTIAMNGYDQNGFIVAAGLALQGLGSAKIGINLNKSQKKGFLGFGGRKSATEAWGIDFGQSAVKVIRLVIAPNQIVTLDKFDRIPYQKISPNLSESEQRSNMLQAVIHLKSKYNLTKNDLISTTISSSQVLGRFLYLPSTDEKTMKSALEYEVKLQIPFPTDEIVWDSFIFPGTGAEKRLAVITAAKKRDAERISELFSANGMLLANLQSESIATANLYANELRGNNANKTLAILDIGAENTNFCVIGQDKIWFRSFSFGGTTFNRAIGKSLLTTNEIAEERKINTKSAGKEIGKAILALRIPFEDLLAEVRRSLQAYQADICPKTPNEIWCIGGGSYTSGLLTYLRHGAESLSIN